MKIKVYISHVFRYKYWFTQEKKQLSIDWIWEFNFKVFVELYVCVWLCELYYIFTYQLNSWYPFIWQKYIIYFQHNIFTFLLYNLFIF